MISFCSYSASSVPELLRHYLRAQHETEQLQQHYALAFLDATDSEDTDLSIYQLSNGDKPLDVYSGKVDFHTYRNLSCKICTMLDLSASVD